MTMHFLTPRFILDRWESGEWFGRFRAATLFVDISGFTAVTEALMDAGIAGGEMLADIMVAIFDPLIAAVYENGGFVSGFAGDAFTAIFPEAGGDGGKTESAARAVSAAWRINRHLLAHPSYETEHGTFGFTVKVGAAQGPVAWGIVGSADGLRTYYFRGAAIDGCAAAEHRASGGDIVLSSAVAGAVGPWAVVRPIDPDYALLLDASPPEFDVQPVLPPADDRAAAAFQPATLLHSEQRGEFRDVFSLFVNVRGPLSDAQLVPFMETFFTLLARYDGTLCRLDFGDKGCNLLLFWGAPTSNENDAQRVLDFALDLRAATELTLRQGITSRMAYAGFAGAPRREEYTCYGLGVNLAARQMMAATWGEIVLDGATVRKATGFEARYSEHKPFKGFAEPQPLYALAGRSEQVGEPHYAGELVGRDREQVALERAIRPIFESRFAGVVAVVGEAGLGKSRLAHTVVDRQSADVLLCQTDEILRQSLNPFRFWLRLEFDQSAAASRATNRRRFDERLATIRELTPDDALRDELQRTRSFLAALLDIAESDSLYAQLEPELRFENTLSALKTLIKALSVIQPVIVLLEDAHWLDADSAEFLRRLTRNVDAFPFAVVVTSRAAVDAGAVSDGTPLHTITLGNLGEAGLSALVADRLQRPPAPALLTLLRDRTDGNPFFVEQMLLYLQENALLDRLQDDGELESGILVPTDVRALLVSRLDKLAPPVRNVVQQAAVLGREFDGPVLAEMAGQDVRGWIDSAEAAAVWQRLSDTRYLFQHALMRDAAYDMQLRARLRGLHSNAARAYESLDAQSYFAAPPFAEIAYHFDRAREVPQAVDYYGRAGEQAKDAYHNEDAIAYFSRGITLSEQVEAVNRFALLAGREAVFSWIADRTGQKDDLLMLAALAEERGNSAERADIELRLAYYYHVTGQIEPALDCTERALDVARELDDASLQFRAYHTWGRLLWKQGRYVEARPYLQQALTFAPEAAATAECLYDLGVTYYYQRNYEDAQTYIDRAARKFDESANEKGKVNCLIMFGFIKELLGFNLEAQAMYAKSLDVSQTVGWRYGEAVCLEYLGNNNFICGDFDQARCFHERALQISLEIGRKDGEAVGHDLLGLIALFDQAPGAAVTQFETALDIQLNHTNDRHSAAFSYTHLGQAYTQLGRYEQAETALHSALEIREQAGKSGLLLDTLAALAECAYQQQDDSGALAWIARLLREIEETDIIGAEFPILVYWTVYKILTATGQEHTTAHAMLQDGYELLQRNAAKIEEASTREMYLKRFPYHNALTNAWLVAGQRTTPGA